jgi:membrane-associated HD superfamily phosphohydrolase
MVKTGFRFVSPLAVTLLAAVLIPFSNLSAKNLGDYQLGDKLEEDVVATTKMSFVDTEATQAERDKEAQRVPVIFRYFTNAPDALEARFRQAVEKTHESFLESVNKSFGHRTLSAEELGSFKFESLAMLFQKQNDSFPVTTNRAALWASGADDKTYQDSLAATLRQAMSVVIHPEPMPSNFRISATVRMVPVRNTNEMVSEQEASKTSWNFSRTNFVSMAIAQRNLINTFPREERDTANFLSNLLEPNCAVDEAVTQKLRDRRTADVWSVCNYEPGQIVAHRGDVVDQKIKTALDHLKEKAVVGQLQDLQAKQQAAVGELQQLVADNKAKGAGAQDHVIWVVAVLAVVILILAVATWQLARRKQPETLLPMVAGPEAGDWQQRALAAEKRTENLQNAARAGLLAHLSQWLSRLMTQRLISQRRMLLETHDNAAAEMAALEARLQKVQAPLQVRLAAYEHRIAELEKELAVRGEENRELLKAKIETMRKQLEAERGKNRVAFN